MIVFCWRTVWQNKTSSSKVLTAYPYTIAGKDRTGVLAALILLLIGRSHDEIIKDYILTRVELENARENLMDAFAVNMESEEVDPSQLTPEALGMLELCGVRANAMEKFLKHFESVYENGIQGYLTHGLGFSHSDIETMRKNLTT